MTDNFGGSSIDESMFTWIKENLPEGSTILELGSGHGSTGHLCTQYKMISIEQNPIWVGKYNSRYIYAPYINGWYDLDIVSRHLENKSYDLIIVDGPVGEQNRWGFLENISLFNTNVPIIIDDIHRKGERDMFIDLQVNLNKRAHIPKGVTNWGVLI